MRPVGLFFLGILFAGVRATADDTACLGCHAMIQENASNGSSHTAMGLGCGACHTDHTLPLSAKTGKPYLTAAAPVLCEGCHAGISNKEFVHQPVKDDCSLCHNLHGASKAGLRAESNALCLECHASGSKSKFETSGPVGLFNGQVTAPADYSRNLQLLALSNDRGHPVSNHPVMRKQDKDWPAVSCMVCHKAHSANRSAVLLVTESETSESLCQRCHT